jgi:hypothetical protein
MGPQAEECVPDLGRIFRDICELETSLFSAHHIYPQLHTSTLHIAAPSRSPVTSTALSKHRQNASSTARTQEGTHSISHTQRTRTHTDKPPQYLDKRVEVQLNGSRKVMGTLRGYDVRTPLHPFHSPAVLAVRKFMI